MHELMELKEKLCKELEEYGTKELSAGTLDVVDKLSHAIKNLDKIIESYEDEGYSGDMMGNRMMGGTSYARRGRGGSYRGSYAYEGGMGGSYARGDNRGRGRYAQRDSMGRYSSERGYSRDAADLADQLRDLMEDAPDETIRKDMERLLRKVEQM
jgi:hypothetical protein